MLTVSPPVGSRTPAHCSGVGKVLLAYSDPGVLNKLSKRPLEKFTLNTITDKKELSCILERSQGKRLCHRFRGNRDRLEMPCSTDS